MPVFFATSQSTPLQTGDIITALAIMLFAGYVMTRFTRLLHIPDVTGYIAAGILLGPFCLNTIPYGIVEGTAFLPDLALAFIAFCTGEFFRFDTLRRNGAKVILIALCEAGLSSIVIYAACRYLLGLSLSISIVLSALAAVTAPASMMMIIRQTNARGDFVETMLQVVAIDDVIGLLEYSIALSIAIASLDISHAVHAQAILTPIAINGGVLLLGGLFGCIMKWLLPQTCYKDNRLIISIALLMSFCGLCAILDVSPLLGCMSMGMVYVNISDDEKLFKQLNYFSPPILLLFFVRSGLSFRLDALNSGSAGIGHCALWIIGVTYFVLRIASKYTGAWVGCKLVGKTTNIRNYLGLSLIPQAGVAIGLAAMGSRVIGGETGQAFETVILSSSILYELVGPTCAKCALQLAGAIPEALEELPAVTPTNDDGTEKNAVEILTEQIKRISSGLPKHSSNSTNDEEAAFTEAAEQHGYLRSIPRFMHPRRHF